MNKAFAPSLTTNAIPLHTCSIELLCPVSTIVQLRTAVDNGADSVQILLPKLPEKNAKDINMAAVTSGIRYAHDRGCKVSLQLDDRMTSSTWKQWRDMLDEAAGLGVDAVELSDPGMMLYVAARHPELAIHHAVTTQAFDADTIAFLQQRFKVSRVTLPPVLSMGGLISVSQCRGVELQLHGLSRISSVVDASRLHDANAAPTRRDTDDHCCALPEDAANDGCFTELAGADARVLRLLPQLQDLGVRAIRLEGASSKPLHTARLTRVWREAIDECMENANRYVVKPSWIAELDNAVRHAQSVEKQTVPA